MTSKILSWSSKTQEDERLGMMMLAVCKHRMVTYGRLVEERDYRIRTYFVSRLKEKNLKREGLPMEHV